MFNSFARVDERLPTSSSATPTAKAASAAKAAAGASAVASKAPAALAKLTGFEPGAIRGVEGVVASRCVL